MESLTFAVVAVFLLAFGVVSARIERTVITPPMIFVTFGLLMGPLVFGWIEVHVESPVVDTLAQATLILVLFTDASRIDLKVLKRYWHLPLRLLGIGLPLTMVLGTAAALACFDGLGFWEAAAVAVILAPTDAALGQAVVASPRVPVRIRQAINVESGLNDGIALPVVLMALGMAGQAANQEPPGYWAQFALAQVVLGPVAGIAIGYAGGRLVSWGVTTKWMDHSFQQLAGIAIAFLSYAGAELIGGNGFIAAFVAGITIGNAAQNVCPPMHDFAETEGQLLALLAFLAFGAADVSMAATNLEWRAILYAVLSLTVVRMLPVSLSLIGSGLHWRSHLFLGWFGPRGLASILYVLIALEHTNIAAREEIFQIVITTIVLSVFAHGLSAWPAARWYGEHAGRLAKDEPNRPEHVPVEEMRVRLPLKSVG